MIRVRTLPICLTPVDGEALDSWLEALAHRNDVRWRDILAGVGLPPGRFGIFDPIVAIEPERATAISTAAGIPVDTVHAMTLGHYQRIWLRTAPTAGTVSRRFPWSNMRGSRYCPTCLAQSGGRWQLHWRLAWSFACTEHRCLLADTCPRCAGLQRQRAFPAHFAPTPGVCARNSDDTGKRWLTRCGADLASAVTPRLGRSHPILKAQRTINDILASGTANFGIYRKDKQPSVYAFGDIRQRAAHLLATEKPAAVVRAAGLEGLGVTYDARSAGIKSAPGRPHAQQQWETTPYAAIAAIGITTAIGALSKHPVRPTRLSPRRGRTKPPVAELTALGTPINPSDELRHRNLPDRALHRRFPLSRVDDLVRRTPSMLWPAWSLRFALPHLGQRHLRPALSVLLLLVDTPLRLADAADLLNSPIDSHAASRVLQLLSNRTDWPDTRTALGRLADYLAGHDTPIDYQRRRRLDYAGLLPHQVWVRICRDTGTPAPGPAQTHVARCYLYERLSGSPVDSDPTVRVHSALRTQLADYPLRMTIDRANAAEQYCREFLADNNITDEPPFWSPPTDIFQGLRLPGPDPIHVKIPALQTASSKTSTKRLGRSPKSSVPHWT